MMCFCLLHHNCDAAIAHRLNNVALSRLQDGASIHCLPSLQNDKNPLLLPERDRRVCRL
ncbi:hypothetical protein H6F68_13215 [Trichocoleus sp. FACHB-262]|nr:hypothetical protein [Trichocoleus sp. FACHB-262]